MLIPGRRGISCPGNGEHIDSSGAPIACCCGECDYLMCCLPTHLEESCNTCTDAYCLEAFPR